VKHALALINDSAETIARIGAANVITLAPPTPSSEAVGAR
jgi:hypothetical protein